MKEKDLQTMREEESLEFLISHEEDTDECTLYIRLFGRGISDFSLTKEKLETLKITIDKCLELW